MTDESPKNPPEPPSRNGIASALEKPCFHQRVERPKRGKGSYRRPKKVEVED